MRENVQVQLHVFGVCWPIKSIIVSLILFSLRELHTDPHFHLHACNVFLLLDTSCGFEQIRLSWIERK